MSQLYIITPPVLKLSDIRDELDLLTRTLPVGAVRLRLAPGFDGPSLVGGLQEVVQNREVALLVEDDIDFAIKSGADGVHLFNYVRVHEARARLGDEANVGANCMASRHAAMEAGEAGADYVAFSPADAPEVIELIGWWSEMTNLPCVAEGIKDELTARRVVEAGADFVAFTMGGTDPAAFGWLANRGL